MDQVNFKKYQHVLTEIMSGEFQYEPDNSNEHTQEQRNFEAELANLARWVKKELDQSRLINNTLAEIIGGMTLDEVLTLTFDNFKTIIPFDRIGCSLVSKDGTSLSQYWVRTKYEPSFKASDSFSVPIEETSLGELANQKQPRIINDLALYGLENPNSVMTKMMLNEGVQSSLTCPLNVDSNLVGFLFFSSRTPNTYKNVHQEFFVAVSRSIALLVCKGHMYETVKNLNEQLNTALEQVKLQSCYDSLTEVYHRGVVMEFLTKILRATARSHSPVSVIMLDLDYFKAVNDIHGHQTGDIVLKKVAQTVTECLRDSDCFGRYGGEEFLIIIPEADRSGAFIVAERIRHQISHLSFVGSKDNFSVTVSMGIAVSQDKKVVKSEAALIEEADKALYQAKRTGRNRVVLFDEILSQK
ncbi:sensor domain-containing diguanylate cyclase [Vibrio sp. RC27]